MTWQNAKAEARRLLGELLSLRAELEKRHGAPASHALAIYPSAHDFRYLRGNDPWSWEFHTEVSRALVRLAAREGIKIELKECTAEGCAAWCEARGLVPDTKNRAAYVGSMQK